MANAKKSASMVQVAVACLVSSLVTLAVVYLFLDSVEVLNVKKLNIVQTAEDGSMTVVGSFGSDSSDAYLHAHNIVADRIIVIDQESPDASRSSTLIEEGRILLGDTTKSTYIAGDLVSFLYPDGSSLLCKEGFIVDEGGDSTSHYLSAKAALVEIVHELNLERLAGMIDSEKVK